MSVTPVPEDLMLVSDLQGHQTCIWNTYIHVSKHTQKIKLNFKKGKKVTMHCVLFFYFIRESHYRALAELELFILTREVGLKLATVSPCLCLLHAIMFNSINEYKNWKWRDVTVVKSAWCTSTKHEDSSPNLQPHISFF